MTTFQSGANIDTRTDEEKSKDFVFKEIVATANPVIWTEKPQSAWRKFPIFNQNGSGSCVAQTMAKIYGVLYWLKNQIYVHFSATHIYQRRQNKPAGGMQGVDAFNIAREGVTLEELVPSQGMTDAQMDSIQIPQYKQDVGAVFKIPNYVTLPIQDIETVASVIQTTGKAVMVWFYFQYDEWTDRPTIKTSLNSADAAICRHSVTAVDFTMYQGKKALIIEDSWGPQYGLGGQRIIDEDFYKARNFFAAYPVSFQFDTNQEQVAYKHTFNSDLQFGMTSDEVKALQDILKYDGVYPINTDSTGYFGAVTKRSVEKFQDKYNVAHAGSSGYGRVGPFTRNKLNELYGK